MSRLTQGTRVLVAVTACLVLTACSGGDEVATDAPEAAPTQEHAEAGEDLEVELVEADDGDELAGADEALPDDAMEVPPAFDLGLQGIGLETPTSGEGPRPELRWEPVDRADSYLVVVRRDADGPASWAWRGRTNAVRVGPVDQPGLGAPEIVAGMVWSVLALDADDEPIAQSQQRPIGP